MAKIKSKKQFKEQVDAAFATRGAWRFAPHGHIPVGLGCPGRLGRSACVAKRPCASPAVGPRHSFPAAAGSRAARKDCHFPAGGPRPTGLPGRPGHGARCLVPGARCVVLGAWCFAPGVYDQGRMERTPKAVLGVHRRRSWVYIQEAIGCTCTEKRRCTSPLREVERLKG